jgi:L-seryl-tRNA(Ser) seleniumtransferase
MASSGALLKEVGTTNKTHDYDYENAINDNTALMLKVHQANFRMIGFTEALSIEELVAIGKKYSVPVMFDLGSGCLVDLKPYGIHIEPTVQDIVKVGADIVTFSGDKLLGGPQAGVIVGKSKLIDIIAKNQLMRAVRVDKMTLAALEVTLRCYLDREGAIEKIPTLSMLLQTPETIRGRARKIVQLLKRGLSAADCAAVAIDVVEDLSQSGGGALAEVPFKTYAVSILPSGVSVNALESRLRRGNPPVIARIKDDALLLDARTVRNKEIELLVKAVRAALI